MARRYLKRHEKALAQSVNNAPWVSEADNGAVTVARTVARAIDELDSAPRLFDVPGASTELVELAGRLTILLKELGLTPAARARAGLEEDEEALDPIAAVIQLGEERAAGAQDRHSEE